MSRYNTQVLSSIRMLCRMQNIDEKVLYERAKLILSIYREVCWSTIDRANDVCDTLICTYGDSLDGALIYLENFAPDEARERFEERIRSLFETKWIIELVDMAMLKIREYPDKGALYCEIISKAYLNRFKYRESEMVCFSNRLPHGRGSGTGCRYYGIHLRSAGNGKNAWGTSSDHLLYRCQ